MKQLISKRSFLGLAIILGTLVMLGFILIAAVVTFFLSNRLNAADVIDNSLITGRRVPLDIDQVDPALALASLGGAPEVEVITEAIKKSRPETALAGLVFQSRLKDRESAGAFASLAPIFAANGQRAKALYCYTMAGNVATLSPNLHNTVRADIFIQVGEGLIAMQEPDLAKFYLDQAFILAAHSPFLQKVHRRSIFERLQKNYLAIGLREQARTSLDLSASPPAISFVPDEGLILSQGEPVPLPLEIQQAETNRWIRAQELSALLVERGGRAPDSAEAALREALLIEDEAKLPFFEAEIAREAQVSRQIDLTLAKIEWLSIKYRVARQAFGVNLVPEWAEQAEKIRADLTKTYETLFALYSDLIIALPQASQIDKATVERLRWEILAGELSRYPNYPEEQRRRQLLTANGQLIATQPELGVFIGVREIANRERYTFVLPARAGD